MFKRPSAADLPQPPASDLDAQLCFALYAATNSMTRAYRPRLAELGLTYTQYLVLLVLWEEGRCTSGHVARRLGLAPNAMTPLLERLEAAGLIARTPDASDKRRTHVEATDAGLALRTEIGRVQHEVGCATGLDADGIADLRARLHALSDMLSAA